VVVVGGVAAGMSAASQAKRRRPEAEVVVLERGPYVSYGACGMPYNLEDPARDIEDLVVLRPDDLRERGLDVRTGHDVRRVDPKAKHVEVTVAEATSTLTYDRLILATGASARRPKKIPGIDRPGVFLLRELTDGAAIKAFLEHHTVRRAVIVGGGYIGMEMAEALTGRGIDVTVVEQLDRILFGFQPEISAVADEALARHGVKVRTGTTVTAIDEDLRVHTDGETLDADLVLVSIGVTPNVDLAREAGVALGPTGAIAVDDAMRTNLADVFAAGDCAEARHRITDAATWVPLGTTANKQGKVAGANAVGGDETFAGILGTAAFKVFDVEVGRTGLSPAEAEAAGIDARAVVSRHGSRGHAYPGAGTLTTVLVVDAQTGRLVGAQMAGVGAVATRIDVFATALAANMTVADIERLDLAYAPPFAPVYDPILIAATVARKALRRSKRV
jgi:NADPH-dependent 2,4-dienoyl-CoA reductase/sulfur reductase-like enzyme